MNFDLNAKSSPQRRPNRRSAPKQSAQQQSTAQQPSTASVPISVYRELSAELQSTQAMLDSLHGQNQHLRKQNIHLQQEVDSIVQAAQKMQYMVGSSKPEAVSTHQSNVVPNGQPSIASGSEASFQENVVQSHGEVPPQLHPVAQAYNHPPAQTGMPPRVSEPPRPQEMPVMPDGIEPLMVRPAEILPGQHNPGATEESQALNHQERLSASPFSSTRRQAAIETLNKIFTGREQPLPRRTLEDESTEEIHTGWLVLIVLLIVVTAFGTGFMLVRPFLSSNR